MNKEFVSAEQDLLKKILEAQRYQEKIVKHGKVRKARRTGERFQQITLDDKNKINDSPEKLYNIYGRISNDALTLQAECVLIKKEFQNNLRTADEMGGK